MEIKVKRFLSRRGFEFKSDFTNNSVIANYTMGILLRKIYTKDLKYVFKQEEIFKKIFYNIIYLLPTSIPKYILYKNSIKIGKTKFVRNSFFKKIIENKIETNFGIFLLQGHQEKNVYIIVIYVDNLPLVEIKKDNLRYGKKNIYNINIKNWEYDKDLLLLLVAYCDIIFFPEDVFQWNALEWSKKINFF